MQPFEAITLARKALYDMGGMVRKSVDNGPPMMVATDGLEDTKRRAEAYNLLAAHQEQLKSTPGDWPWGG